MKLRSLGIKFLRDYSKFRDETMVEKSRFGDYLQAKYRKIMDSAVSVSTNIKTTTSSKRDHLMVRVG